MQAEAQEDWILRVFAARAGSELERLHAEERLRESEARARTLLESHFDGVVLVVDGRIVYANRALWQLAGFPSAEALVGRSPEDFVVAAQREQLRQQMADDLSGNGTLAPTEYLGVTIDGSTVPVEVLGRRIDFEGSPAILAAVRDITERKQVERERRELEHQLAKSQRLRSVGQLAAGVVEWLEGKISWESPRGPAGVPSRPEGSPCPADRCTIGDYFWPMARAEKRLISPTAFAWLRRCATRAAGAVHAIEVHGHQILCPEGARRRPLLLAHPMMSLCFHTRPAANSPTGLGNSGWVWAILFTRWRVMPSGIAISFAPTRNLLIVGRSLLSIVNSTKSSGAGLVEVPLNECQQSAASGGSTTSIRVERRRSSRCWVSHCPRPITPHSHGVASISIFRCVAPPQVPACIFSSTARDSRSWARVNGPP